LNTALEYLLLAKELELSIVGAVAIDTEVQRLGANKFK